MIAADLLLGQARVGSARHDGLGVDARARAGVEAGQDPAVAVGVEEGEREALVAAGLLERVVPDETGPLECPRLAGLEDLGAPADVVDLAGDLDDLVQVRLEDRLQALSVRIARQPDQPRLDPPGASGEDDEDEDDEERGRPRTPGRWHRCWASRAR